MLHASSSILLLASFVFAAVKGHGMLIQPITRANSSDLSFANTISATNNTCHGLEMGPAYQTFYISPESTTLDVTWLIVKPHNGSCVFSISYDKGASFTDIAEDPNCASSSAQYRAKVDLGAGYKTGIATLRWLYKGMENGKVYQSCADISLVELGKTTLMGHVDPLPNSLDAPKTLNVTGIVDKGLLFSLLGSTSGSTNATSSDNSTTSSNGGSSAGTPTSSTSYTSTSTSSGTSYTSTPTSGTPSSSGASSSSGSSSSAGDSSSAGNDGSSSNQTSSATSKPTPSTYPGSQTPVLSGSASPANFGALQASLVFALSVLLFWA